MAQATIDNFTQLTTEPSLASYLLVLDKTLTAPQTRGNRLYNLLEAIMKGMTVARMDLTSPTTLTPSVGDTYVVAATGTGAWGSQDNNIAVYASASEGWVFLTPDEGWIIYDQNLNLIKLWNGAGWVDPNASNISYDDSSAAITASSVQAALDALDTAAASTEYGNIYTRASDSVSISSIGTTPQTMPFSNDGADNVVVSDSANNRVTLTTAGIYKVEFTCSFATNASGDAGVYAFVAHDDGVATTVEVNREMSGSNDAGSCATHGLITVGAGSQLTISLTSDNGSDTDDITIYNASLTATLLEPT